MVISCLVVAFLSVVIRRPKIPCSGREEENDRLIVPALEKEDKCGKAGIRDDRKPIIKENKEKKKKFLPVNISSITGLLAVRNDKDGIS